MGSSIPAGDNFSASGNVANAQAAARRYANSVISFVLRLLIMRQGMLNITVTTGCEAAGQRVCIAEEHGHSGIGKDRSSCSSHQWVLWSCCGRQQSRVGRRQVQITLFNTSPGPAYYSFSAYNVREEWHKERETLMDVINYIYRRTFLPCSAMPSTRSTAPISSHGMHGHTGHAFHPSPFLRIPLHDTTRYGSPVHFQPLP